MGRILSGGRKRSTEIEEVAISPPRNLKIPGWFAQFKIYGTRDFLSKISNRQYLILTLFETPILGFILSYIIRYVAALPRINIFGGKSNIPIYIFMALIVALFIGLQLSAEEIFKDRKILKREVFEFKPFGIFIGKNFNFVSYFRITSFGFCSCCQIVLSSSKGMLFVYWFAFFTTAAYANMLGLNISASFLDSAVLIYILIPLVIIPMMVLSGAMFSFDKLNRTITRVDKVPILAEFMPTKWSYEALMVHQFKDNQFESNFYEVEKRINNADFKQSYFIPELENLLKDCKNDFKINAKITITASSLKNFCKMRYRTRKVNLKVW